MLIIISSSEHNITMIPKISIILPCYKTEQYLPLCLKSVQQQTFKDWELICVDDGSPDNLAKIIKQYQSKDKRIKYYHQENQGLSGARNTGLKKATGNYVFFLDSDDQLPKYALKTLYTIAKETKVPLVASRQKEIDKKRTDVIITHKHIKDDIFSSFVKDNKIHSSACNKLYKKDILKNRQFIQGIYFEDWPFLTMLAADIDSYAITDIPCYIYREDNTSITRSSFNQKKADSYLKGIDAVYCYFEKRDDLRIAQKRMAIAMKMLINKTYKSRNKDLQKYVSTRCRELITTKVIKLFDLPLKSIFRLWKMK